VTDVDARDRPLTSAGFLFQVRRAALARSRKPHQPRHPTAVGVFGDQASLDHAGRDRARDKATGEFEGGYFSGRGPALSRTAPGGGSERLVPASAAVRGRGRDHRTWRHDVGVAERHRLGALGADYGDRKAGDRSSRQRRWPVEAIRQAAQAGRHPSTHSCASRSTWGALTQSHPRHSEDNGARRPASPTLDWSPERGPACQCRQSTRGNPPGRVTWDGT
jgi:hypothetical protein